MVAKAEQGKGIGKELINYTFKEAAELKIEKIFALTEKPGFFEKIGFKQIDKSFLPHKIWRDCVHCVNFPDCSEVALIKDV